MKKLLLIVPILIGTVSQISHADPIQTPKSFYQSVVDRARNAKNFAYYFLHEDEGDAEAVLGIDAPMTLLSGLFGIGMGAMAPACLNMAFTENNRVALAVGLFCSVASPLSLCFSYQIAKTLPGNITNAYKHAQQKMSPTEKAA